MNVYAAGFKEKNAKPPSLLRWLIADIKVTNDRWKSQKIENSRDGKLSNVFRKAMRVNQ